MTNIKLHGLLAKEFGKNFRFKISKPKDCLRAIDANRKNFIKRVTELAQQGFHYTLIVDGKKFSDMTEWEIKKEYSNIEIVPVILGSGPVIAAVLVVVGVTVALNGAVAIGISLILTGLSMAVQMALAPKPDAGPPISATTRALQESFRFSNKANLATQGSPVPFGYGRLKVGSKVIQYCQKSYPLSESSIAAMTSNPFNIGENNFEVSYNTSLL